MNIDEIETGSELDDLIASRVMEWERCFTPFQGKDDDAPKGWIENKDGVWIIKIFTPKFSTDIVAAWEVWKKLNAMHNKPWDDPFLLSGPDEFGYTVHVSSYLPGEIELGDYAKGETAPEKR